MWTVFNNEYTDQCKVGDDIGCPIKDEINGQIQFSIAKDILVDALEIRFTDTITFMKTLLQLLCNFGFAR